MAAKTVGGKGVVSRIKRPRSLTSIVVDQIRDLIITGKLALGEQLSENTIAEMLGVSRTPVRDAFLRLEAERLVEVKPQRGTFVFDYDANVLREMCELRKILEIGAMQAALRSGRAALVAALRARVEAAESAMPEGPSAYQAHDTNFHETLVRASENHELIEAYNRISGRIRAVRYRLTRSQSQISVSQRTHRAIVDALDAGDDATAESELARHVYNSHRFFLKQGDGNNEPASAFGAAL